ncbi:MAG: tetratricopeptide repeat protein [Burkholderiaceae bacterium]|nr:tetratricopeptide repeat protein [Burkholderiaceae bacterium]
MLAEGILWFSLGQFAKFDDRIRRARGIAIASSYNAARAACASWLALSAFNDRRYEEMISLLREAFELASVHDHQARARASLVLADAFHLAGRFDLARPWYERTRQHATSEGDESTLSAMLHNVAAFRASNVKLADALGTYLTEEARRAALEATSAAAYDHAIGTKSFDQLLPHVVEQLFVAEGKYKEAFDQLARMDLTGLPARGHATHFADYALCAWKMGERELAEKLIPKALAALDLLVDSDDAAYTYCRLASLLTEAGQVDRAAELKSKAIKEAGRYREFQAKLEASLAELTAELLNC